jgi:hypothetical protein
MSYLVMDCRNNTTGEIAISVMVESKIAPVVGDPEKECITCLKPIPPDDDDDEDWTQLPNPDGTVMGMFCGDCVPQAQRDQIRAEIAWLD